MTVKVTNSQAALLWGICVLQGEIFVKGVVQVKDGDGRVVRCDVDTMDLGLMVGVHLKDGDCKVVSNKYQHSCSVTSFPVQHESSVSSDGESVAGVQVCLWNADHTNVFFM